MPKYSQRGNVFFIILLSVALFAGLAYTVTSTMRGTLGIEQEEGNISASEKRDFLSTMRIAEQRLRKVGNCDTVNYEPPEMQNPAADKTCTLFHAQGGGVSYQEFSNLGNLGITEATYGHNCGVTPGMHTAATQAICTLPDSCSIAVNNTTFGDPTVGCAKNFVLDYTCQNIPQPTITVLENTTLEVSCLE